MDSFKPKASTTCQSLKQGLAFAAGVVSHSAPTLFPIVNTEPENRLLHSGTSPGEFILEGTPGSLIAQSVAGMGCRPKGRLPLTCQGIFQARDLGSLDPM